MKQKINILKNAFYYIIPIVLLIYFIINVLNTSIWLDEAFSLFMMKHDIIDMVKCTAIDVHPPLYYILLKVFISIFRIVNPIIISKIFSILPIIILLIISYTTIKNTFGKKVSFIFNLLLLGMPHILYYSIEIRMYSFAFMFVTLLYLYSYRWCMNNNKKDLIKLTIFAIASVYTHYFSAISAMLIYFIILVYKIIKKEKKDIINILISGIIVSLCYLPWIYVLLKQILQVKESYWIPAITNKKIEEFIAFPYTSYNEILSRIIELILIAIFIIAIIKHKDNEPKYAIIGMLVPLIVTVLGIVLSIIIRPIFISRYIVCSLGCLWLAVSIIVGNYLIKNNIIFYLITILLLTCSMFNINNIISVENNYRNELNRLNTYFNNEKIDENTIIIFDNNELQRMFSYYYDVESFVYDYNITELSKRVYINTNMKEIQDFNDIEYENKNAYLVIKNKKKLEELNNNIKFEDMGLYQLENYKFNIYKIQN